MKKIDRLKLAANYFPDAKMELNYKTNFQMLVAVMLSAQTTDKMVNKATKELFEKYFEAKDFKNLGFDYLYEHLKIIGFAKTKSKNLIKLSRIVDEEYKGEVVNNKEELLKLPGVGIKTANAVLANAYGEQYIAVDTHVFRICKRLDIVKQKSTVEETEKILSKILKNEDMNQFHHSLIFFGRYHCIARNPKCDGCKLKEVCYHNKKTTRRNNG